MSTKAIIGQLMRDTSIRYVEVHYDGYLSHVGRHLHESYRTDVVVSQLMSLGDLKCLYGDVENLSRTEPRHGRHDEVTIAWHRDHRQPFELHHSENFNTFNRVSAEYVYLFNGAKWLVRCHRHPQWEQLSQALITDRLLS